MRVAIIQVRKGEDAILSDGMKRGRVIGSPAKMRLKRAAVASTASFSVEVT